ncbi:hypothetical protein ACQ4LE_009214 [Meloidogyne hapla]
MDNRLSIGTSGSLTNIGTLSPVVMFDWIRNEIQQLQADQTTRIFAQALERQSDRVLQIMRSTFENKGDDVSKIMLACVSNFTRNKNQKLQDFDDFVLISHYLWKLLCKVVAWKVKRSQNGRSFNDAKKDEYIDINKDNSAITYAGIPYNHAILKTSKRPVVTLGTYSDRPLAELSEDEMDDEDDESLIKIPSRKLTKDVNYKGLQNYPKPIKTKDESSSQRVTTKQLWANEKPSNDQTNLRENASTEGQRHQLHGISSDTTQNDEPTNCDNVSDIDDDRYLRASLREESLDDLFSNDKAPENPNETHIIYGAENTNEDQNVSEVATDVKKELVSDTEEEGAEAIEEQLDEQQRNLQNSIIFVKQEVENDELSNNGDMESAQVNNSVIIYYPTENQESSSASSPTDPLPDLHQDIPPAPVNLRLVQLSAMGTSSSSSAHSQNQPLKWDFRNKSTVSAKAKAASKVTREVVIDSSCSNTDIESEGVNLKRQRLDSVEQEISQSQTREAKHALVDDAYSEFSVVPQQSKLPWHVSPTLFSTNGVNGTTETIAAASSSSNKTGYSSKIKKYRLADYLQEQKAKRMEMKKGRNVDFCLDRTAVYNFVIDEGNVIKRYNYVEECKVHVPGSTSFLKRPLGYIPRLAPPRHRKLTSKLQDDIRTLVSEVMLRAKQVVDQNSMGDINIAPAERLCRISRLFVTDSMLAGVDDEVFRNMFVFRLDFHKNMDMFIAQLDALRQLIFNQLCAFEFSYIFILYGYDLINQDGKPSLDSTRKLKSWFEDNLVGYNLQKTKDDCVYQYSIPQFVVITLPEIGSKAEQIKEYNNELRILVQNKHGEPNGNFKDFILLDWAQFMTENVSNSDELAFKVLVRKLAEFGVLFK